MGMAVSLEQAITEQREYPAVKAMAASQDYIEGPKAFSEKTPAEMGGEVAARVRTRCGILHAATAEPGPYQTPALVTAPALSAHAVKNGALRCLRGTKETTSSPLPFDTLHNFG